jgi:AbrB family looped-hinge helix DNA binding protein
LLLPKKNGINFGMIDTITLGKAGRLVVPKAIRDRLGLREGSRLKLVIQGGGIYANPEPDPVTINVKNGFPVISGTPPLAVDSIVSALKADRENRSIHRKKRQ